MGPRRGQAERICSLLPTGEVILAADDGTRLLAEWDRGTGTRSCLAVLLHGWEGCSRSPYQVFAAGHLLQQGFDVLRINFRDHGDSLHLNRELFNSTRSPEVASALLNFVRQNDYRQVFLGGYSLGGNFALRIAADLGPEIGLAAVVAVCPPVDPANAMAALNNGWFVYERYFFRRWSRSLRKKLMYFPDLGYGHDLAAARTVDDLNDFFIPRFTGFPDKQSYFAAYALSGDRLADLRIPAYIIASKDDPIIPAADLAAIDPHPMLRVDLQRRGGHCGFMEHWRGITWAEKRLADIFRCHRSDSP